MEKFDERDPDYREIYVGYNEQDDVYATTFEGTIYDIGNTMEWLKSSIDMALTHEDVRLELLQHMKQKINQY